MKTAEKNEILTGSIGKQLLLFFFPIWLGTLFQQLYNTVDTLIVGNFVGTNALAAVGSVGIIVQLVIGAFAGVASGAGVVAAQHMGAGDKGKIHKDIKAGLRIAIFGGLLLTIVGIFICDWSVAAMGTPEEISQDASLYLKVYFAGLIPNLIYNMGTAILRGLGDSKRPVHILIASSFINIFLDLVFVIGFKWGVFGVAFATDLSMVVSAVWIIVLLKKWEKKAREDANTDAAMGNVYGSIFKIGLPGAMQSIMYASSNIIIQVAINGFGTNHVAAWTIVSKLDFIFWMTMNSFGVAITTFAGQNYGARQIGRVKKSAGIGGILLFLSTVAISILLFVFKEPLFHVFTQEQEVVQIGIIMVNFFVPCYLTYFLIEDLSGVMRGCGDVVIPTVFSVLGVCGVRFLWTLGYLPSHHTLTNLMACYPVSWILTSILFVVYYFTGKWLKIKDI